MENENKSVVKIAYIFAKCQSETCI